jgi:hypothetical protein
MKCLFLFALILTITNSAKSQLKTTTICPNFEVDVLDGRVNELTPRSTIGEIKGKFPCFTSIEEAGSACGSSVFYKDKDIYFFQSRNYIEIKEKFKGKLSVPLIGAARTGLFKWLGHPKIKDVNWDAFLTSYGTLIVYYSKAGKVNKIQLSTESTETIKLCE